MAELASVTPRFAAQPEGVAWPTREWPRATDHSDELERVVDELFTREELAITNAVVVVRAGRVLCERYGGEKVYFDRESESITRESALLSWSMAKSILHAVLGTLVDDGRLDPDQLAPVPEWRDPADPRHQIRIRDLLAMRDGLDFIEEYEIGAPSDVLEMLWGEGREDMAAFTARRPLAHPPGSRFNYSSGTTNVLSRIVADQVGYGDRYEQYLRDRLFDPLGMVAVAGFDGAGVFVGSSFVHARALDFARFGLLYLRGGEWDGRQIISRDWAATAQVPLSREEQAPIFYSWQWWVGADRYGTYWASGYEGQRIYVVPALDAVIVRLGRTPSEHYPDLVAWRDRLLDVLARY